MLLRSDKNQWSRVCFSFDVEFYNQHNTILNVYILILSNDYIYDNE